MSTSISLAAFKRETGGTGSSRALRRAGMLPAIIYGDGKAGQMVSLPYAPFLKEYLKGNIQSKLVALDLEGHESTVLIRDVQIHRVPDVPEHVDLQLVHKDTVVRIFIQVRIVGEERCPGLRKGGVMNVTHRTIECRSHPSNIPQYIDLDVSAMEIGHTLHINDIQLPEGVNPVDRSNFALVSIVGRAEEGEEKVATVS